MLIQAFLKYGASAGGWLNTGGTVSMLSICSLLSHTGNVTGNVSILPAGNGHEPQEPSV